MSEPNPKTQCRNILLRLAYDGTDFYGWQVQPQKPTIQGILATTMEQVCGERVHVCGAGRTDAGVHACGQAANVRLASSIPCPNLVQALNDHLPESIRVFAAQEVPLEFHARHDAQRKIYCYQIFRRRICPPWLSRFVYPFPYPLAEEAMQEAARYFEGTRDFRSLASAEDSARSEEKSFVRTVFSSSLATRNETLVYTIEGDGFLHHMVRNIVGTLLLVGRRRLRPPAMAEILRAGDRAAAGPTAPARGLHLVRVIYPDEYHSASAWDSLENFVEYNLRSGATQSPNKTEEASMRRSEKNVPDSQEVNESR